MGLTHCLYNVPALFSELFLHSFVHNLLNYFGGYASAKGVRDISHWRRLMHTTARTIPVTF